MKRVFIIATVLLVALSCQKSSDFVSVKDGHFLLDGKPYSYVGANFWYGAILASPGEGGDRDRLLRELDTLHSCGIDNLRILVGGDGPDGIPSRIEPTLQKSPGVYNDDILEGLDYLLTEMGRRNMKAVLYLNNSWEWSGGYSQYLEWAGAGKAPIPAIDGWGAFSEYVTQYAGNREAQRLFENYVKDIVSRTNSISSIPYSEDPAIMSWQIGNEPRAFSLENREGFLEWMSRTSALIRSIDKNHLISTGSEGKAGCEGDLGLVEELNADPNIDYITIHIWPLNWGWITSQEMDGERLENAICNTRSYIDEHLEIASRLGKPVVLEEFGYPRDGFAFTPGCPTTSRDAYYTSVFSYIKQSRENNGGLFAGCNFWGWGGLARPSSEHMWWQKGDPYTGDPAQEQQGLNSVFACDSTTVEVISKFADELGL